MVPITLTDVCMQQTIGSVQHHTEEGGVSKHTDDSEKQDGDSLPDHEFDNPIYGTESDENTNTDRSMTSAFHAMHVQINRPENNIAYVYNYIRTDHLGD